MADMTWRFKVQGSLNKPALTYIGVDTATSLRKLDSKPFSLMPLVIL